MGATNRDGLEAAGVHKILCLLDALRQSQTGNVIYRQVEYMLEDVVSSQRTIEQAYVTIVNQLLDAYLSHLRNGSPLQVQVRLLRARLQPPLTARDLEILRKYIDLYAGQIEGMQELDAGLFQNAVEPLLQSFGIIEVPAKQPEAPAEPLVEDVVAATPEPGPVAETPAQPPQPAAQPARPAPAKSLFDSEWPLKQPQESETPAEEAPPETAERPGPEDYETDQELRENHTAAELRVDGAYRSHLDSKRRDIQKLQSTLAQQVLETIAQNEEFGVLLEVVLGELRQAGDGSELEDLRWTLIREIEKLTKGHHDLAEKLDSTHHYLQLIESDSRQLSDELTRVRLLSLTDELTGLPNRRAFLRRIEDEVARVQRYGFPLSLALMDLDFFKQVNDKYGHAGGDEVLQIYSKNILSIFRHHDLVARYGGEEFAVLLPNTDAEGSLRALTKVKNRAAETRWQANGELLPVPTFSAGLSLYKPGETASAFIERADKALYRAKRLGRNRVEVDATFQTESTTESSATPAAHHERQHRNDS